MDRHELLDDFARHLREVRARAELTVAAYVRDAAAFLDAALKPGEAVAAALARPRVGLYLMQRTEARRRKPGEAGQLSSRSAARALSAISALARYLVFQGELAANPLQGMKPPKFQRKLPPYLSVDELAKLVRAWGGGAAPLALRNTALLALLYSSGLRVSECAGLDLAGVSLGERNVRVTGKGGKTRVVPFGAAAQAALAAYLERARPALCTEQSGAALWLNRRGGRLSVRAVWNILDLAALKAGLAKHVSPHKLRHACATHMLEGGADVRLLQEFLGHASLNTTQVYTQITMTRLREVYEQSHPRARRE